MFEKTLKVLKENYAFILFQLFLLLYILYLPHALALEKREVSLDFSKIENPWGLSETIDFDLPENALKKKYYHLQISSKNELNVWYYDNEMNYNPDTGEYKSTSQKISLDIYLWNASEHKFKFSFTYSYDGNTIGKNDNNIIWSSYDIESITTFPDLTYVYNESKKKLEENSVLRENIEYFVREMNKLSDLNIYYIISLKPESNLIFLTFAKEEFSSKIVNDGSNDVPRYTTTTAREHLFIDAFTKEWIDNKIAEFRNDFDNYFENAPSRGTLAGEFWEPYGVNYSEAAVIYSSFSSIFNYNSLDPIIIDGYPYPLAAPTLHTLYKIFNMISVEENEEVDYPPLSGSALGDVILPEGDDLSGLDTQNGNDIKNTTSTGLNMLFSFFPIIDQVKEILNHWEWNGTNDCIFTRSDGVNTVSMYKCYLVPNVEFTFLDHEYNLEGFDVTWYLKYRDTVAMWIKLSIGTYTLFKVFKIVQGMFHGK